MVNQNQAFPNEPLCELYPIESMCGMIKRRAHKKIPMTLDILEDCGRFKTFSLCIQTGARQLTHIIF